MYMPPGLHPSTPRPSPLPLSPSPLSRSPLSLPSPSPPSPSPLMISASASPPLQVPLSLPPGMTAPYEACIDDGGDTAVEGSCKVVESSVYEACTGDGGDALGRAKGGTVVQPVAPLASKKAGSWPASWSDVQASAGRFVAHLVTRLRARWSADQLSEAWPAVWRPVTKTRCKYGVGGFGIGERGERGCGRARARS